MNILAIEIRHFRVFQETVILRELSPGLNIIAGDNEEGKSTILCALQAALFNRYNSSVAENYVPFAAAVTPRVVIKFQIGAVIYVLIKAFSKKRDGGVSLSADDGRRWQGPAAEDFLAELLGFSYALRGGSRFEQQGVSGLLWLEQGRAFAPVTLNPGTHQQLRATFSAEIGEMLGGEHGQALYQRILEQRAEFFDKRDKPRGLYREAQQQLEQQTSVRDGLKVDLATYEKRVATLEELNRRLREYQEDRTLAKAETNLASLHKKSAKIKGLESQLQGEQSRWEVLKAGRTAQEQAWQQRVQAVRTVEQAVTSLQAKQDLLVECQKAVQPARERAKSLKAELDTAREQRTKLEQQLRLARSRRELVRCQQQLAQMVAEQTQAKQRLLEAQQADALRRQYLAQQQTVRVTEKQVEALRTLEQNKLLAEEHLKAMATRLDYVIAEGQSLLFGNESLAGEGSRQVLTSTCLQWPGGTYVTIHPSGQDIRVVQRKAEELTRQLSNQLANLGVENLQEALNQLRQSQEWDGHAKQQATKLAILAPNGLAALQEGVAQRTAMVTVKQQEVATWIQVALPAQELPDDTAIEPLEQAVQAQEIICRTLETKQEAAEKMASQLEIALGTALGEVKLYQREAQTQQETLRVARERYPDTTLQESMATAQTQEHEQQQQCVLTQRLLQAENPAQVAMEVEQADKALAYIRTDVQRREREMRDLTIELNTLGQRGLAEELAKAEGECLQTSRHLKQLEKQAQALDLLFKTLDGALRRAKEQVAQPIVSRMTPYLQQIFPDCMPVIDENLELTAMQRSGMKEPFTELSIGTREQLAVLVRLAYADLLQEKGIPVLLVLDDALVYSDDLRRDQMKKILYQAAKKCQILLLTCHGRAYRDTAGTFIELRECKS